MMEEKVGKHKILAFLAVVTILGLFTFTLSDQPAASTQSGQSPSIGQSITGFANSVTQQTISIFTGQFAGGDGTQSNPYQISTCQELQDMQDDLNANYELIDDINCSETSSWNSGKGFDPVGNDSNSFSGSLDGRGFTISNLWVDRPSENQVGLFGSANTRGSEISNLSMVNASVNGFFEVGILAGVTNGLVSNVSTAGEVEGTEDRIGGLIGFSRDDSKIEKSYSEVSTTGRYDVGGLIGYNNGGNVFGAYSSSNVSGDLRIGGLFGSNEFYSKVNNTYAISNISGNGNLGGFAGFNDGTTNIYNSYALSSKPPFGRNDGSNDENLYWDVDTSGVEKSYGIGLERKEMVGENASVFGAIPKSIYSSDYSSEINSSNLIWSYDRRPGNETTLGVNFTIREGSATIGNALNSIRIDSKEGKEFFLKVADLDVKKAYVHKDNDTDPDINLMDDYTGISVSEAYSNLKIGFDGNKYQDPDPGDSIRLQIKNIVNPDMMADYNFTIQTSGDENFQNGTVKVERAWDFKNTWQTVRKSSSFSTNDGYPVLRSFNLSRQVQNYERYVNQDIRFSGGKGTENNPYEISNCRELQNMESNLSAYYELTGDINCFETVNWNSGKGFDPIGNSSEHFQGQLRGNNRSITKLYVNRPNVEEIGLISSIGSNGSVSNTILDGVDITGDIYVGVLTGVNNGGKIRAITASGKINGSNQVAGLVGQNTNSGLVNYAYTNTTILGGSHGSAGLVGNNHDSSIINNSYSIGSIETANADGLVGYTDATAETHNSYWDVETSNRTSSDGGIGLNTSEMHGSACGMENFTMHNWNFFSNDYPKLNEFSTGGLSSRSGCQEVPEAEFSYKPMKPKVNEEVLFNASNSTGDIQSYEWDWTGDGVYEDSGKIQNHSFTSTGNYTVILNITDSNEDYNSLGLNVEVEADYKQGNGSESSPFEISSCQQLQNMRYNLTANYELVNDVDCSSYSGFSSVGSFDDQFSGVLNGRNHTVKNLTINEGSSDHVGLIGDLGSGGEVKNIGVVNADINGNMWAGALVGSNYGSVSSSYSTGSVSGLHFVGGLVGYNYNGIISSSYSTASASSSGNITGGLVSFNKDGSVSSSYSTGTVSGGDDVGGFIGDNRASVSDSYWDTESSGQFTSEEATGLTTSEMQGKASVCNMDGFDFQNTWVAQDGNYPHLRIFESSSGINPDSVDCSQDFKAPEFDLRPEDQTILEGMSFIYDIDARDNSGTVYWNINSSNLEISDSGVVRNTTSLSRGNYSYEVAISDPSGNSNSAAFDLEVLDQGSNLILDSKINQTYYSNTNQLIEGPETLVDNSIVDSSNTTESNITGSKINISTVNYSVIDSCYIYNSTILSSECRNSVIEDSNIENSTTIDSDIDNSTSKDSDINDSIVDDCYIDNSTFLDSQCQNSEINDSLIDNSTVKNSTVDNSTLKNSTIENGTIENGTIENRTIIDGCLNYSGDQYCGDNNDTEDDVDNIFDNLKPVPSFTVNKLGDLEVELQSTSSDPDGSIVETTWMTGDGNQLSGSSAEYTYSSNGNYTVTLTVQDNVGATSEISKEVELTGEASDSPDQPSGGGSDGTGGSGGGSGGGYIGPITDTEPENNTEISMLNYQFNKFARPEEEVSLDVNVKNTGEKTSGYLSVVGEGLPRLNRSIEISGDSANQYELNFTKDSTGYYEGRVILQASGSEDSIPLRLNVTEEATIYEEFEIDVQTESGSVYYTVNLPPSGEFESLEMILRDPDTGRRLDSSSQILAEAQESAEGNFTELQTGSYQLIAELEGESEASTSRVINIENRGGFPLLLIAALLSILLVGLAVVYRHLAGSSDEMTKKEIKGELKRLRAELISLEKDQSERIIKKLEVIEDRPESVQEILDKLEEEIEEGNYKDAKIDLDRLEDIVDKEIGKEFD